MQSSARESYLVTEVMTATPQKLQLMLIEAAIRSAQRARQNWQDKEDDRACEALIHAQHIVGELMASLNGEVDPELVKRVAAVYLFVFRTLTEANYEHDEKKLDDAVRVLQIERETWRRVCEQLGSEKAPRPGAEDAAVGPPAAAKPVPLPIAPDPPAWSPDAGAVDDSAGPHPPQGTGLSLEA